jgi:hypothetical protein
VREDWKRLAAGGFRDFKLQVGGPVDNPVELSLAELEELGKAEQIDEMGANLIAIGSHGRTGVLRLLMGSVSRKVLDQARCPVTGRWQKQGC